MNQILNTKKNQRKIKKIFKIQLILSVILIILGIIYIFKIIREKERENNISKIISLNAKINSVFTENLVDKEDSENDEIYFGRIICDKINLDYFVYNKYSEDNLKVLPCKFSGGLINENGNICIIGHNYYDDRFFCNLNKLENNDVIILKDLEENSYKYSVYKKYEINEIDTEEVIKPIMERELTLCTCTFDKEKRLVVKAKFIND